MVMNVLFSLICMRIDVYVILFNCIIVIFRRKSRRLNSLIWQTSQENELVRLIKLHFEILSLDGMITRALMAPLTIWMMWSFTECTANLYVVYDGYQSNNAKNIPYVFLSIWWVLSVAVKFSGTMWLIGTTFAEVILQ